MSKIKFIVIIILYFSLSSCSITKKKDLRLKSFDRSNLLESIINENTPVSNLIISYSANINFDNSSQSVNGQIRLIKDSLIWINATAKIGIEIGRALFTKYDFKIMIPSQKTVYEGDYQLSKKYLGTFLNFDNLQYALSGSILQVKQIFDINKANIDAQSNEEIRLVGRNMEYFTDIIIDSKTLKPKTITVKKSQEPFIIEIKYRSYITIDNIQLPQQIDIISTNSAKKISKIEISYRKIETNNDISIPFKVPARYEIKKL